jgi:hypothetical protein
LTLTSGSIYSLHLPISKEYSNKGTQRYPLPYYAGRNAAQMLACATFTLWLNRASHHVSDALLGE